MIVNKKKPDGYVGGLRFGKGDMRPCDKCGALTNHYQHDFESNMLKDKYYFMITECKKCSEEEEKFNKWLNKHEFKVSTICPWCDYEFEPHEDGYEEEYEEECTCPRCGKDFIRTIDVSYLYTTHKPEELYEEEE